MQIMVLIRTHFFTQRLCPDIATIGVSSDRLSLRWRRNSIFACVRPVIAEDDDSMCLTIPCFVYVAPEVIMLKPHKVQNDKCGGGSSSTQESRQEPHGCLSRNVQGKDGAGAKKATEGSNKAVKNQQLLETRTDECAASGQQGRRGSKTCLFTYLRSNPVSLRLRR